MSFSTSGPAKKDPGNINLSGQKPARGDGKSAEEDLDDLAAKPESSGDASSSRPSARRRRRGSDTGTEKTAERDEGSADSPSEKTGTESAAQDAPAPAQAAKDDVAEDDKGSGHETADTAADETKADVQAADSPADDKAHEKADAKADEPADKVDVTAVQDKTEKAVDVPAPDLPSVIDTTPAAQSSGAHGLFGVAGSGDTSGMSGLMRPAGTGIPFDSSPRPYGGYFDEVADVLAASYPNWSAAHLATLVDRGEITFYVKKEHISRICQVLRDTAALRFELLASLSGVDYLRPDSTVPTNPMSSSSTATATDPRTEQYTAQRLHVVYHLLSLTYRRRIRVEIATTVEDPHVPSVSKVYPTADWQERETYDMFGVVFDGHQALTRILMPDDWEGFPQRKDYPLGGIPVEYKGASIPPPDERRVYR